MAASAPPTVSAADLSEGRVEPAKISEADVIAVTEAEASVLYKDYLSGVLLTREQLRTSIRDLARRIAHDYAGKCPHLLCILNGASVFMMRLCEELHHAFAAEPSQPAAVPYTAGFVRLSSYEGTESTGAVQMGSLASEPLRGREVLVVEDIVDTGISMAALLPKLRSEHGVKSARVCSLIEKRTDKSCGLKPWYVAYSIPDAFVVGFGLDLDEAFRDMQCVGIINEAGIAKFKGFGSTLAPAEA